MNKINIYGAGISGMTAAIYLKKRNPKLDITLYEANDRVGQKILKTGNGKCNLSNTDLDNASNYNNPSFMEEVLKITNSKDLKAFILDDLGLVLREDDYGRLYPYSEKATSVLTAYLQKLKELDIKVVTSFRGDLDLKGITIIATGSYAQSKYTGYNYLTNLGHKVTDLNPALTTLKVKEDLRPLKGIRFKVKASILKGNKVLFSDEGEVQFREDALSGIVTLDLSRYYKEGCEVSFDLVPEYSKEELEMLKAKFNDEDQFLNSLLPKMLALEVKKRGNIISSLKDFKFTILGLNGYNEAQITKGGLDLSEIGYDFSSKIRPNLYVIGEVLDIDARCGGFNIGFAIISGITAGKSILKKHNSL